MTDDPFDFMYPPGDGAPGSSGAATHQFNLVRFADIKLSSLPPYLVDRLIPREGLVVIWGPPKCGKTFFVFDLCMHIALGWEYRGRRVEPATVVYIACEGERGLAARKEAFRRAKIPAGDVNPPFYLLTTRLDLPDQVDALMLDIAAQIPASPCGAIVLDTLNRSIHGSESKDEDMSAYIAAADALRDRFKCAIIIIHHSGINDTRPRGHTSLTGAADAQIAVKRDNEGLIIATVQCMKDGGDGDNITSSLRVIDVGTDDNGQTISSCVIEPADNTPASKSKPKKKLSPKDQIALDTLNRALAAHGTPAPAHNHIPSNATVVSSDLWRRFYLMGTSADDQPEDTRRKAWRISYTSLFARKIIWTCDAKCWIV
jgi:hypothetical protein